MKESSYCNLSCDMNDSLSIQFYQYKIKESSL